MLFSNEAVQFENNPVQETGYFTAHEIDELVSLFQLSRTVSPVTSTCSDGSNQSADPLNERKRRRMISNREAARRSRCRKKRHLEDLTEQAKTLESENRELKVRLDWTLNRFYVLWRENERLNSESSTLLAKLSGLNNALAAMHTIQHIKHNNLLVGQNY